MDGQEAIDELYETIRELKEQREELLEALKDVQSRIERSEEWWMDCPDRGGFDTDKINNAIAKAT